MKTRITELFGIKYPIMLAGMNYITEPKLVATVCNAGGLGILAVARFTPKQTREQIRQIRELTDKPFGINQALALPKSAGNIDVALEEKVPVVNYSYGKPWFIDDVHAYGGKVIGTVILARYAARAEQMGCDAVVVTGHESGGHGGLVTMLVLLPIVASQVKIPILAAGGIYDGRGLAAVLALGADGVSLGTRFTLTKECVINEHWKELVLKATEADTIYSDRIDGDWGRVLEGKGAVDMINSMGFPLKKAIAGTLHVKKMLGLSWWDLVTAAFGKKPEEYGTYGVETIFQQLRKAGGTLGQERAVQSGDDKIGFMFAGQNVGGINDIPTVSELMERMVTEAEEVLTETAKKYAAGK